MATLLRPSPTQKKYIFVAILILILLASLATLMLTGKLSTQSTTKDLSSSNTNRKGKPPSKSSSAASPSSTPTQKKYILPEEYANLPAFPCTANYTGDGLGINPNLRIIDYILLNNEMDMLEIRLRTILKYVDHLIIAEAPMTFTGKPRSLVLDKFLEIQLKEWGSIFVDEIKSKLVHVILPGLPKAKDGWEREQTYRRLGLKMGLYQLGLVNENGVTLKSVKSSTSTKRGLIYAIISTDLDEIPRSSVLKSLSRCQDFTHTVLQLAFYYYSFQFRNVPTGYWETYPRILSFNPSLDKKAPDAQDLRVTPPSKFPKVLEAGWHCSFCFKNFKEIVVKVKAYSHVEHDQPKYFEREHFLNQVREGLDLFDREDNQMRFVDENYDYPDWIKMNLERFMYLIDRKNEYAGFFDIKKDMEDDKKKLSALAALAEA
ncbi:hypothetical protein HDU76_004103 [Blyttiomyces sp. JEL0837]|nr:hypothetical protein HDU76_004103 [Blyttiomyces sp. JEL0837]